MDNWQNVASSTLEAISYDGSSRTLKVRFKSGKVYHYDNVPPEIPEQILTAPSAGQAFHDSVKDQFRHTRG